ncbi:MAG: CDP-alcohol phosphatidyltransferase family protein [Clostridia bacterium]|nr:CDP-alcohol phosphatidyltransferase family protein [Clostridia bacterium]
MNSNLKDLFKGCWTVPNLLSALRIVMVPIFAVLFYHEHYAWAVFVLALSGLSDFFDGKIARRFNQVSALGKILDPVADKLTQITIAVMFYLTFRKSEDSLVKAFSWVFLIFLIKELVMVVGGGIMLAIGLRPSAAEMPGKVATFVFYVIMILIIAFGPGIGILRSFFVLPSVLMLILVCISVVLTLVAFCSYMPGVARQLREKKEKEQAETQEQS